MNRVCCLFVCLSSFGWSMCKEIQSTIRRCHISNEQWPPPPPSPILPPTPKATQTRFPQTRTKWVNEWAQTQTHFWFCWEWKQSTTQSTIFFTNRSKQSILADKSILLFVFYFFLLLLSTRLLLQTMGSRRVDLVTHHTNVLYFESDIKKMKKKQFQFPKWHLWVRQKWKFRHD